MDLNALASRIRETAYLEGEFTLRSGRKSNYYLDKYLFETQPDILEAIGRELAGHLGEATDRIAGAELGGVPLAASTAMACRKPFVIVRNEKKDYGTGKLLEGVLEAGDRILLVEDVVTTGGQLLEAARVLVDAGAVIERIVAVIDRQEGARESIEGAGFEFHSILTVADIRRSGAS